MTQKSERSFRFSGLVPKRPRQMATHQGSRRREWRSKCSRRWKWRRCIGYRFTSFEVYRRSRFARRRTRTTSNSLLLNCAKITNFKAFIMNTKKLSKCLSIRISYQVDNESTGCKMITYSVCIERKSSFSI